MIWKRRILYAVLILGVLIVSMILYLYILGENTHQIVQEKRMIVNEGESSKKIGGNIAQRLQVVEGIKRDTSEIEIKFVKKIPLSEGVIDVILDEETGMPRLLLYESKRFPGNANKIELLDSSGNVKKMMNIEKEGGVFADVSENNKFLLIMKDIKYKGKDVRKYIIYNDNLEKVWEVDDAGVTMAPEVSPDGSYVLAYGFGGVTMFKNDGTKKEILTYQPTDGPEVKVYFSNEGEYFAVYYKDEAINHKIIAVFDKTGKKLWENRSTRNKGGEIGFSPDNKYIVARVSISNNSQGEKMALLKSFDINGHEKWYFPIEFITIPFYSFGFSEDGKLLLVGGYLRNIILLLSMEDGSLLCRWHYPAENFAIVRLYRTKDLKTIVVVGIIFEPGTKKTLKRVLSILDRECRVIYEGELHHDDFPRFDTLNYPYPPSIGFLERIGEKIYLLLNSPLKIQKLEIELGGIR